MRRILIGTFALIMALPGYAANDKTTTSVSYVGTALDAKQAKLPAAGNATGGTGSGVLTYTSTSGTIGERGIFTGGEYNASTDADKMITAAALNGAITSLTTDTTSKLVCQNSPDCTLWTIVDQTAYGAGSGSGGASAETLAMLQALVGTNGTGYCYKTLSDGTVSTVSTENCTTTPSNYGDWGVMFTYNNEPVQVSGISACSTLSGKYGEEASDQAQVQSDYESNMSNAPTSSPVGGKCYCKMTGPAESRWVYLYSLSVSNCPRICASSCADYVQSLSVFRGAVFGAVQQ